MARRRRRSNPRNTKGRFVKRAARRARRVKANPKRKRARRVRRAKANPVKRRARRVKATTVKRRRRARRNPAGKAIGTPFARVAKGHMSQSVAPKKRKKSRSAAQKAATRALVARNKKGGGKVAKRKAKKRSWHRRSKGLVRVGALRRAIKRSGPKRSVRRSVARVQYQRASVLRRLGSKQSKSPLAKAMHIKTNPGIAGLIAAAKTLAPQAGVGGLAMFGLAFGGRTVAVKIRTLTAIPASIDAYVPAISTVLLTGAAYVAADKFAPKFKGAVAIGGLLGAIVQAIVAAATADATGTGIASKAKAALLGDYTTVGEYTTVGGRAYADGGLFREVGEYTTVGGGDDNATEFAHDSLRGLDDTSEFAPGEGGVLSGGLFR